MQSPQQPFVLAVRSNETLWPVLGDRLGQHAATDLAEAVPASASRPGRTSRASASTTGRGCGAGHPPAVTVRVLATLRQFLREGTPWRSLRATEDKVSGSTLHRCLEAWARTGVLAQVHAMLVAMLRGNPDLILDTCSVRARRGGDLTGPNPTDRGKRGTKYRVAVTGNGVPVACLATAANVNDTLVFERLFLVASRLAREF